MYRIKIHDRFSSAHYLDGYQGKCESLHGHNWKVEVELEGEILDDIGMLMDFKQLKELLRNILKDLDHCLLNELDAFKNINPSSELIARHIYLQVKGNIPSNVSIANVSVWESENSVASYFEN